MWNHRTPDYVVTGASDTTVYLLHGTYGGKEYWAPLARRLAAAGFRVIAWDAPGYGSSPMDPEFSIASAADKCARLIGKTGTRKNVVLGHSMGGQIAMRVFEKIPGLIDGIVISCSLGYLANQTPEQRDAFFKARETEEEDQAILRRKYFDIVTTMMGPNSEGPDVELVKQVGSQTPAHAVRAALNAVRAMTEENAMRIFSSIQVPALFIAGAADTVGHPASIEKNSKMVAGASFSALAGCGHYPWAEDPAAFWKVFHPFLSRV